MRNVIRKIFSTNYNDEFCHVMSCYLEDSITIFLTRLKYRELFFDSDSFVITKHFSLVNLQINYCNNNVLFFDVKQVSTIMKLYYFLYLKSTVGRPG